MEFTQEQIQEAKAKYGKVFKITSEDGKVGYLRKPNRTEVAYYMQQVQSNPIKANESLLKTCWVGGDEDLKNEDSYFYGVGAQITKIINVKTAEISEL